MSKLHHNLRCPVRRLFPHRSAIWARPAARSVAAALAHAAMRNMTCRAVAGEGTSVIDTSPRRTGRTLERLGVRAVQQELVRQGARIT